MALLIMFHLSPPPDIIVQLYAEYVKTLLLIFNEYS